MYNDIDEGMGCGGSKEIPNLNNNHVNVEVKSTVEDQDNGDVSLVESYEIDSPSPLALLTPDNNDVRPPFVGDKDFQNTREILNDYSVFDAGWNYTQPKQSAIHNEHLPGQKVLNVESEQDSEYGKDGIDLTSTSFAATSPKKSGVLEHGIQFEVTQRLTKNHSQEPFDPSSLVDIDKFKAVNAPRQAKETPDNETTVGMDNNQGRKRSISNGQVPQASPTNYHEYYDEDEKALMESIEQDFVGTVYTTLPGAVV